MATIELETVSLSDLRKMYEASEKEVSDLQSQVEYLASENAQLDGRLDEALAAADVNAELRAIAEAVDMIVAGDMSTALHTIRRACDDAKVQDACDRAFSKFNCLVPA